MNYKYLAQDEYDVIEYVAGGDEKKIKDPIEINLTITMELKEYQTLQKKYEHVGKKVMALFGRK